MCVREQRFLSRGYALQRSASFPVPLLLAATAGAAEDRGPRQDKTRVRILCGEKKEEKGNKLKRIEVKLDTPRLNCDV